MGKLRGEVTIAEATHTITNGTLRVRLIDVSRADAPAVVVSERTIPDVSVERDGEHIGFELDIPGLEPGSTYALEAHLDASGTGETSVGDYRTMEHIGVSPTDRSVTVPVRPVG